MSSSVLLPNSWIKVIPQQPMTIEFLRYQKQEIGDRIHLNKWMWIDNAKLLRFPTFLSPESGACQEPTIVGEIKCFKPTNAVTTDGWRLSNLLLRMQFA